jgi:hypothetical protein
MKRLLLLLALAALPAQAPVKPNPPSQLVVWSTEGVAYCPSCIVVVQQ